MHQGLSGGSVVENPPANARHTRLIPGLGKMPQAEGLKEETDRAGLHLRPGCEHQATQMATLPMHSELCVYRSGIPMGNQTPRIKEPQDLDLDSPLPKRIC